MSALLPDGREKVPPVDEDGHHLQLVHKGWEDNSLEMLQEVLGTSIPKVLAGRDTIPVHLHGVDVFYEVHLTLSLQDTPEKQVMVLSCPLDSGELLGIDDRDVF